MEYCRKKETGSCTECPLHEQIARLIKAEVPYQEVLDYVTRQCPVGFKPALETRYDENGTLNSVIIEGIKMK